MTSTFHRGNFLNEYQLTIRRMIAVISLPAANENYEEQNDQQQKATKNSA
jgi:hypothetical protein